jgi:hypothetical protein
VARVIGIDALNAAYRRVANVLSNPELRKAYLAAGRLIRDEAKTKAPRGKFSRDPGSLRKALQTFAARSLQQREKIAAITWVRMFRGSKKAPHAHLVEFGTAGARFPKKNSVMIFKGRDGGWVRATRVAPMPATHFFRRSVDARGLPALRDAFNATNLMIGKAYDG